MSYGRLIYDDIDIAKATATGGGYINNAGNWIATPNASASNPVRLIDGKIHKSC